MRDYRHFTSDEIAKAATMRSQGFKWRTIAERFGRSPVNMRQQNRRAKKPIDHRQAENEALVAEYEYGTSISEMAAARGWSKSRVCMRLTRAGLDAELRSLTRPLPKLKPIESVSKGKVTTYLMINGRMHESQSVLTLPRVRFLEGAE